MYLYSVYQVQTQSSIQCGECTCTKIEPYYILDCEKLGLEEMPVIESFTQRLISRIYMSGNFVKVLNKEYFLEWYSLQYIDLSENPELGCDQISNIPEHVKVDFECTRDILCKYTY